MILGYWDCGGDRASGYQAASEILKSKCDQAAEVLRCVRAPVLLGASGLLGVSILCDPVVLCLFIYL